MDTAELCEKILEQVNEGKYPNVVLSKIVKIVQDMAVVNAPILVERGINICNACNFGNKCHVPGAGPVPSDIMVVGEAPGQEEDDTGLPFVGPPGQLLDKIFGAIGWDRKLLYLTNVLKCRPPGSRTPALREIVNCKSFLDRQIEICHPKVIICIGSVAANTLIHPRFDIVNEHGIWFNRQDGVRMIAIYHPAYLLKLDEVKVVEAKTQVWTVIQAIDNYLREVSIGAN